MEKEEGPDHFTLQDTLHTHCRMLTPHHASLPEKTQDSENAFHSEASNLVSGDTAAQGGSNYPGHRNRRERG